MAKHLLRFVSGPLAFILFASLPFEGLPRPGRLVVATFLWALTWWFTRPVPLGITALLPIIVFPALGVMNVTATAALYGQTIFFWVMGLALLGHAMEKHGLAKRFAIGLLGLKGFASTTHRLLFFYMLAAGCLSVFITDSGVVAMMLPIGISLHSYIQTLAGRPETKTRSSLGNFIVFGTLYAAIAGGVGSMAGAPPNVVAVSVLEKVTGEAIGWFRWMKIGIPLFLVLLVIFYWILRFLFPPELTEIPGGQEFLRAEARKLGKMNRGEKNVLVTFVVMVLLFTIPSIAPFLLGNQDPVAVWLTQALSIWTVPPTVLFLLFVLPTDIHKREFTLSWRDAIERSPWDAMLLCTGAVGMTDALSRFGFVDFITRNLTGLGIGSTTLPILAAFVGSAMTEITSGTATTALLGNILIPVAVQVGFNPASLAVLLSNVAIGKMFPWSGAPSAVTFASGHVEMKDMIKVALVVDGILALTVALMHLLFAPIF